VDEYDDVVAVRSKEGGPSSVRWPGNSRDAQAFQQAGWRLVPRSQAEAYPTCAQVIVKGERLLLAPNRVVVKFADEMSSTAITATLDALQLEELERLTFARNLVVVAQRGHRPVDVFEVAKRLLEVSGCEFAEPDLLEALAARPIQHGATGTHR
jgi:hypothetical protein